MNTAQAFPLLHDLIVNWVMRDAEKAGISTDEAAAAARGVLDNNPGRAHALNTWLDKDGIVAERQAIALLDQQTEATTPVEVLVVEMQEELTGDFQ